MAFPGDYTLYDEYVIQASKVAGTGSHADFPVYVDLSDLSATFWSNVKSDGGDIRVTLDDGTTQLAVEVVAIDTVAKTGELHFKAASLSTSANTTARIWYNGTDSAPAVTSTYGRNNVWTLFDVVMHMTEEPDGTADEMVDSTGNGNDGTTIGSMTSGDSIAGAFGGSKSLQFDGSDDYVDVVGYQQVRSGDFDISCWMRSDNGTQNAGLWGDYSGGGSNTWSRLTIATQGDINFSVDDGVGITGVTFDLNWDQDSLWHLMHCRRDSGTVELLGDASSKGSATEAADVSPSVEDMAVGWDRTGGKFEGRVDEFRAMSGGFRSDDWITAEYNNQSNHATWAVVTAKTGGGGASVELVGSAGGALFFTASIGVRRFIVGQADASVLVGAEIFVARGLSGAVGGGVFLQSILDIQQATVALAGACTSVGSLAAGISLKLRLLITINSASSFGVSIEEGPVSGVDLTQSAEAAFPDRPTQGGLGLLVSMSQGDSGSYVEHGVGVDQDMLHVRFVMRDAGIGGGSVVVLLGLDESDEEVFRLTYDAGSHQILIVFGSGSAMAATLREGLLWYCVELKIDTSTDAVILWVNGRLVDTVTGGIGLVQANRLWFGGVLKDQGVVGELYLDEWVISDKYIGPVVVDPAGLYGDDPARWLVVYNTAEDDSVVWAEGYKQDRGVPYANLLGLSLSTEETITFSEWLDLFNSIAAYLADNGLEDRVLGILVGYRVPGYVDLTGAGFLEAVGALLHHTDGTSQFNPLAVDAVPTRPTKENMQGLRLTARIDGVSLADAQSLVTRAISLMEDGLGNGSTSQLWFNPYTTPGPGTDPHISAMVGWVASTDRMRTRLPIELTAEVDPQQEVFFSQVHDDGFVWGWSEPNPPQGFFGAPDGSRVFCFPLYSITATAPTLRSINPSDWSGSVLGAGYASMVGSSRSYSLSATPYARPFFEGLRRGWTLSESWFVASPVLGEGLFLIGDPLMKVPLPRAGWDIFGPVGRLEEIDPESPSLSLREDEYLVVLPEALRPSEGSRLTYLIRHLDDQGRSETGTRVIEVVGALGGLLAPPVIPVWPDTDGWRVLIEDSAVRLNILWDWSLGDSQIERVELEGEIDGGVAQVLQSFTPRPTDRRVQAIESLPVQAGRYRWRLSGLAGAVAYTPWSEWVRPLQVVPVSVQIEGVHP